MGVPCNHGRLSRFLKSIFAQISAGFMTTKSGWWTDNSNQLAIGRELVARLNEEPICQAKEVTPAQIGSSRSLAP